ncbi:MAG: hypothetical protein WCO45_02975 [Pseudanabaena sp. ELA607]|jgi:hypothetical protein
MKKALASVLFLVFSLTAAFCMAMTPTPAQATVLVAADSVAQSSLQITDGSRHDLKARRRRPTGPKPDDDTEKGSNHVFILGNTDFLM